MDELKLHKRKEKFELEIEGLQIEFDSFFMGKKLADYYRLKVDKKSENLLLEFTDQNVLPKKIVDRIIKAFDNTKPEDSI